MKRPARFAKKARERIVELHPDRKTAAIDERSGDAQCGDADHVGQRNVAGEPVAEILSPVIPGEGFSCQKELRDLTAVARL